MTRRVAPLLRRVSQTCPWTLLALLVLLSGCAAPRPTPAPMPPPAVAPAPSPQPSPQPGRELKGWQRPYEVFGERYYPLMSHEGFVEDGIASWYGSDFHGRKTSNGEVYDMHAMTAAHKTLPLGIYVRVVNQANGRETVVRLNDRGPFVRGRVIDLSYAAAKEIDMVGPGTVPVRIEALGYRETDSRGQVSYRAPQSFAVSSYSVQVGAFAMEANARRLAQQLQADYGRASVHQGWVGGQLFHRVRAGDYRSLEDAERARLRFEAQGYRNSFVVAME